tara:strand:- start:2579 stop:6517 length:3939 start_codon:yes stop_codon:yes gene_type:complete
MVADRISVMATKYAKEVLNTDIKFESMVFNLYPPGASFKNVHVKVNQDDIKVQTEIAELGVFFNPLDFLNTSFQIDQIKLNDGYLRLEDLAKSAQSNTEKEGSEKSLDDIKEVFQKLSDIPINRFIVSDVHFTFNKSEALVKKLGLDNLHSYLRIQLNVFEIKSDKIPEKYTPDSLYADLILNEEKALFEDLVLKKGLLKINSKAEVDNYLSKNLNYKLRADIEFPLKKLHSIINLGQSGQLHSGDIQAKIEGEGGLDTFNLISEVEGTDIKTDFIYADKLSLKASATQEAIDINDLKLVHNSEQLKLVSPFELFNLKTKKWIEEPVIADLNFMQTRNFLRVLKDRLNLLDGSLSGRLRFELKDEYYSFQAEKDVLINHLSFKSQDENILTFNNLKMQKGLFKIEPQNFTMNILATNGQTKLNVAGEINKEKLEINLLDSTIDLNQISPVFGYEVAGTGDLNLKIRRTENDEITMDINSVQNNFMFDGYKLDQLHAVTSINFDQDRILIKRLNGLSNKTSIVANGEVNYQSKDISINYSIENLNFNESKRILSKYLSDTTIKGSQVYGRWDTTGKISGKATKEGINILGQFEGINNYFFNESVERVAFSYQVKNLVLTVKDFVANKSLGKIFAFAQYDIEKDEMRGWTKLELLPLAEFSNYNQLPFNFNGYLSGQSEIYYIDDRWRAKGVLNLDNTTVESERYADSELKFTIEENFLNLDLNAFGNQVQALTNINLNDMNSPSELNLKLNISNLKKMAGIVKGVDILNSEIEGSLQYNLASTFFYQDLRFQSFTSHLKEFNFIKKPITVNYASDSPEIVVEDGVIKKWDFNLRGEKFYILSNGEGDLQKDFDIVSNLKVDASIIETFNSFISKANGNIRGKLVYKVKDGKEDYQALLTSSNLSLSTRLLPTAITKASMAVSFEDQIINIDKFNAQLITGSFLVSGKIDLNTLIPDVDIRYKFKDAGVSILQKSNLVFSGEGALVGKNFPYTLGGDFYIQKCVIVNEIADFAGNSGAQKFMGEDIKYLPGKKNQSLNNKVEFNINVSTRNPIFIANSLADIGFNGNVQVLGGENDPRLSGRANLAPRNNRITFKNNEFVLTKGSVFFTEQNEISNPDLDFQASTKINEYQIEIKVYGPAQNFTFDLSSEPALSQSDILSLIAFGYTEDLSNNLSDSERESMTRAGIGSLIFDSFKINETLKNEFGIQVNLGTEISEDEQSLLSARNAEGGDVNRIRSATTFELKKQLSDAMSLSVSSTVGNSLNQRQSLNLNYNVNRQVSVEGVYEQRSTDQVQTINDDTSFGADLKVKWSFR